MNCPPNCVNGWLIVAFDEISAADRCPVCNAPKPAPERTEKPRIAAGDVQMRPARDLMPGGGR